MILVAHIADTHINSTVGLCPPRFKRKDGGVTLATREQGWIGECWSDFWQHVDNRKKETGAKLLVIWGGDIGDLNFHRQTQLVEDRDNREAILDAMLECAEEPLAIADENIVIRGTEAHSGGSADLDEAFAKHIGASPSPVASSWWHFEGDVGGVLFNTSHHPRTSGRLPHTKGPAAARLAQLAWAAYAERHWVVPNMVGRSHVHYWALGFANGGTWAYYTPPWQLSDAFAMRCGAGGDIEPLGGVLIECGDGLRSVPERYPEQGYLPPRGKMWKMS